MNCIDNAVGWVKSLGGVSDVRAWELFALMAETHRHTPQRWSKPIEQGGRDGVPTPHAIRKAVENSGKYGVALRRDHFFTTPPAPIQIPKQGRPAANAQKAIPG